MIHVYEKSSCTEDPETWRIETLHGLGETEKWNYRKKRTISIWTSS